MRLERYKGHDPLATRQAAKIAAKLDVKKSITFEKCADEYIDAHAAEWRNEKHRAQWRSSLARYAFPTIGSLAPAAINVDLIVHVLRPIWTTKVETATRLRGRMESILDYAKVCGYRDGDNPARLRGNVDIRLGKPAKLKKVEHHAALDWRAMSNFMQRLRLEDGVGAMALRLLILTAGRTGEVIGATWKEVDLEARVWTVPRERMKAGKEHRVPLSEGAIAALREAEKIRTNDNPYVFPGEKKASPLSNMAMLALLRRMKRDDLTVHGFRSTFRDWAGETGRPDDLCEAALAHSKGNKVQEAYQRGDLLERRRVLMNDWADWCAKPTTAVKNVVCIGVGSVDCVT